jgi:2,4-dienoyl-CoA reductase (NADPH2)
MSADDFVPGGVTTTDTGPLAQALEAAGVDLIDVSAGTYESILRTQPPMEADPGGLISLAAEIKRQVSVPVAVAGKLSHLDVAEGAVASRKVDFVTIGRGLHADPALLTKARSGRLDEVRMCIACAECVDLLGRDQVAACAVNPATTRERALRSRPAAVRKRVLVVGGGPSGMEAARAARLRGHSVRLLERSDRLGGQARFGALADGRSAFAEPVRFLQREMRRLGVAVTCGVEVDGRMVADISPEATILAVGATPAIPTIPGSELPHVLSSLHYLAWEERVRTMPALSHDSPWPAGAESAVIIGASWEGCHVAHLLLQARFEVSIVEIRPTLGYDIGQQPGAVLRQRILEHPRTAGIHLQSTVEAITAEHVTVWDTQTRELTALRADVVVLVAGREPNHELATAINQAEAPLELARVWPHEIIEVGDGVTPRKLQDALLEGALAGSRV